MEKIIKSFKSKPPSLLRGLLSIIMLITGVILFISCGDHLIFQIENFVTERTSEYAHSITQVAANAATEPLNR